MQTISKSKLKAQHVRHFSESEQSGDELIVTDNNRPVLLIRPLTKKRSVDEVFADFKGKVGFTAKRLTAEHVECAEVKIKGFQRPFAYETFTFSLRSQRPDRC